MLEKKKLELTFQHLTEIRSVFLTTVSPPSLQTVKKVLIFSVRKKFM